MTRKDGRRNVETLEEGRGRLTVETPDSERFDIDGWLESAYEDRYTVSGGEMEGDTDNG